MIIRYATAGEMREVGDLRISAYLAGGFLSADSDYVPTLRALGADGAGHVLVAVLPGGAGKIVGTVMLQPWPHAGELAAGPDEAEIRALAVAPDVQGEGVGAALLQRLIGLASEVGVGHLVLFTQPDMRAAHRLYVRFGFARLPDRDWTVMPGLTLLAYGLRLGAAPEPGPAPAPAS